MSKPISPTNVLVVGSGGREHAKSWKISQSKLKGDLFVAPGNGGTQELNVPLRADDIQGLRQFAKKHNCFTIVGPEAPLAAGIVDSFIEEGLQIFGPTQVQAKLETSKVFAKELMLSNNIPTAQFESFTDSQKAIDFAYRYSGSVVVKADGLASGKGVFVCSSVQEAEHAIESILEKRIFGESGSKIIVERKLDGKELSLFTVCNGKGAFEFGTARDHKRAYDGDKGPNTGGMGAISPVEGLGDSLIDVIFRRIVRPTIRASSFRGFLYFGLMLTEEGPKVLEFNARLGDPETQAILPRLNTDLLETLLILDSSNSEFEDPMILWNELHTCVVVMCAENYPQKPVTGDLINGVKEAEDLKDEIVFHSSTQKDGNKFYTSGGRVLSVTGTGMSAIDARTNAYAGVNRIFWRGEHHRRDIGLAEHPGLKAVK